MQALFPRLSRARSTDVTQIAIELSCKQCHATVVQFASNKNSYM